MLYSLLGTQQVAIGGVKTLLVAPFASGLFAYADQDMSLINSFSGLSGWQRFECGDASEFGEGYNPTKNGDQYSQAVSVLVPALSKERRSVLQALLKEPVLCLVLDYNGNWWLYGQDRGLRVPKAQNKGGAYRGESSFSFSLEGIQDEAARVVLRSFINLIFNNTTPVVQPGGGVVITPPAPFGGFAYKLPAPLGIR
ncbi:hypothetical protein [Hymenobacter sp. YC55]|uniref:hypothetical protein n=1 Tax=Hymenobacter sp. YC55 TaxID=3034019 RepID=UPI0023F87096|nr:hypothetical protein [Hymenobacter sp. YC55]MDF7810753.1 hypothetical protein [Hymenobacter sp. YC55]